MGRHRSDLYEFVLYILQEFGLTSIQNLKLKKTNAFVLWVKPISDINTDAENV